MAMASVRYIVDDVDAAIDFYTQYLGFAVDAHPRPGCDSVPRGIAPAAEYCDGSGWCCSADA